MATKSLAPMRDTIAYRNAAQQPRFRPSVKLAMAMQHNDVCPHCSSPNVYGIEHLALMGLVR